MPTCASLDWIVAVDHSSNLDNQGTLKSQTLVGVETDTDMCLTKGECLSGIAWDKGSLAQSTRCLAERSTVAPG